MGDETNKSARIGVVAPSDAGASVTPAAPKKTLPAPYQPGDWAFGIRDDKQDLHGFRANDEELVFVGDPVFFLNAAQASVEETAKPLKERIADLESAVKDARQKHDENLTERNARIEDLETENRRLAQENRRLETSVAALNPKE
jgi:hypothetical protein